MLKAEMIIKHETLRGQVRKSTCGSQAQIAMCSSNEYDRNNEKR